MYYTVCKVWLETWTDVNYTSNIAFYFCDLEMTTCQVGLGVIHYIKTLCVNYMAELVGTSVPRGP